MIYNIYIDSIIFCFVVDICYVLSFVIIMLNISFYNFSVKDKFIVERFIFMNRGINDGGDLVFEFLTVSYFLRFITIFIF